MTPPPSAALSEAGFWLQGLVLGSLATAVATLAVALLGFALLAGRISARQAAQVAIGAFILFSAPVLARGFLDLAQGVGTQPAAISPPPSAPSQQPMPPPERDPYAGAAVPGREPG